MTFSAFKLSISKIGKVALPGTESHQKMLPPKRQEAPPPLQKTKKAGVMALFYPNTEGETMLALILRKTYKGVHSAQIGFPGGKVEPEDRNMEDTALRETEEEIGVPTHQITVLKTLTPVYIPPSNYWVHPFIGICEEPPNFVAQATEVEEIIKVKLETIIDDNNLINKTLTTSYTKEIKVPAFKLNGYIVWGATGMMLNEVKALLKEVL